MIQQRSLLCAAPIAFFLATTSCSSTESPSAPTIDGATGTEVRMDGGDASAQQDPQAQSRQLKRNAAIIRRNLEAAELARANGDNDFALNLLLEAERLDPGNKPVLRAIRSLRSEMGSAPGTALDFGEAQAARQRLIAQRAKSQVEEKKKRGQEYVSELQFDLAIQQYRAALLQIEVLDALDWGSTEQEVQALLADATERRYKNENAVAEARENEALRRTREAEARAEANRIVVVNGMIADSQRHFVNKDFRRAQQLAANAMRKDPNSALAKDLYNASAKAMQSSRETTYYETKAREYLKLQEAREEIMAPTGQVLSIDEDVWARAAVRPGRKLPISAAKPDDVALTRRVAEAMIQPMRFSPDGNGPYTDAYKLLGTITKVPILITTEGAAAIADEDLKLDFDIVAPMSLQNMLDHMASLSTGLAWTIRHGVVLITSKAKAGGENTLATLDVRSLIFPITEFLPPSIRDIPSADVEPTSPRTGGVADERVAFIELDALITSIKSATGAAYWDGDSGASIDQVDGGYLLVKANQEMLRKVSRFLDDMDSSSTSVVTIETKFLTINQNFMQEVGFDFRGGGGSGNKGTVAKLDDVTNGNDDQASRGLDNSGTADPAASPNSGFFYDDGNDGDFRGRTENYFENSLGKILTPTGGLTAAWTFLNDIQLNMIFRAVEKNENAQMVNAQTVTVLNNNRANVSVINQTSYVRDFDVEVAQASFIADPKIDVIHDGVVLDVRPIIRHDRRSVTLVLQPTVAELQRPIPEFTTSLAGSTLPVTLQLPVLTVRSFATTAQVPDGGTVLIGGLRTILNRERRAETPILGSIPIIGFFFKQEGIVDESSSLMVMVKARITNIVEEMRNR